MPATIKIKNSSTTGAVPTSSDLVQGELAVNVTDKRLFTENASGTVVELGTNPTILTMGAAGSASAPVITRTGDTNTGIFFPAADTIAFAEGGTEAMRLDSSGNMGLGVTPSAWSVVKAFQFENSGSYLHGGGTSWSSANFMFLGNNGYYNGTNWIYSRTNAASQYSQSNGEHRWFNAASGTAGNTISFTQAMTLDASGRLTVGYTSAGNAERLGASGTVISTGQSINTFSYDQAGFDYNASTKEGRFFSTASGGAGFLTFYTASGSERARIDSSGNWLVGRTSGFPSTSSFGCYFGADGTLSSSRNVNGTSAVAQIFGNAGEFRVYGNGSYATISDARIKENVVDATPKLQDLMGVRIVNYNIIGDDQKQIGVIAQELSEVFPALVDNGESEEDTKAVRYSVFVPMLIKAIQEQQAIIDGLTARITALEA